MFIINSVLLCFYLNICGVLADERVVLIKHFIENERRPTHLILNNLCWDKALHVELAKSLVKYGVSIATTIEAASKYTDHSILFISDLDCSNTIEALENATERNLIRAPYQWLLFSEKTNETIDSLQTLPLLPDSDWVLAENTETGFVLTEIHKASINHSLQFNARGFFNRTLIDVRRDREIFQRRKDLQGFTITMATMIQDSNTSIYHLDDGLEVKYDFVTKVSWWILKMAAEMLNANATNKFAFRWGYKQNGKWDGMMNMINSKEVDLGTNCMVLSSRLEVVTYADMLVPYRVRFIFRQPPLSYISNIFYLPLSAKVWIATLICTAVSCLALYFATNFEARFHKKPTQLDGSLNDALLLTMSAVSQQGSLMEPIKASGRITLIVQFMLLMSLYVAYSANIVVLLQAPSNSIKTLPQLADSKLTLAAHKLDYNYFVLQFYNDSLHQGIYRRINPTSGISQYYSIEEGVERIRQGLFAIHSLVDLVYRQVEDSYLEKEKCDLMEVDFFNGLHPAVPMQKHSPYLELLRVQFKRIREAGLQSALNRRVQVPKPLCTGQAAFNSVGLLDMRGVILILLYGFALSIVMVLLEILIHIKVQKHKRIKEFLSM